MYSVKLQNEQKGYHFFSAGATGFFGSRYAQGGYKVGDKVYFVTSERDSFGHVWGGKREYTIRVMDWDTGNVDRVSDLGQYGSSSGANKAMIRLIQDL